MKNSLSKIVLATMIAAAPLAADYAFDTHSLFAIEGGMTNVHTGAAAGAYDEEEMGNVGLKIGAETEHYRVFLSARYYDVENLSTLNTYGAEIQYMFNFSKPVNFFIGANGGVADIKLSSPGIPSESISEMYYGADAGFNIHATDIIDIEVGAKYMALQDAVALGVSIDEIVTAYASVIIKWKMD